MSDVTTRDQRATFGAAVRRLREARGWSQADLAQRVGTKGSTVAGWEQGRGAREENVRSLERTFDLNQGDLGWILGQAPPPAIHLPEDAIAADPRIPEHHKRPLLAHLAAIRRIVAED